MDELVRDTYDKLASGAISSAPDEMLRPLLYLCFEEGAHEDVERRLTALRVATHIDARDRMRVVDPLIRDADPRVRRYAFNLACAARLDGIEALRTAVGSPDVELAVEALACLVTQLDRASSLHARQWLKHDDARIRAGAAMLLGNVAGPAMAVHLGRIAQTDPVAAVRVIAAEAVQRCTGDAPKLAPRDFWVDGPVDLAIDATPSPEPARPQPLVARLSPPPRAPSNLATLYPDDPISEESTDDPAPVGMAAPAPAEQVRDAGPIDWRVPIPLPTTMPSEAAALLKLFARVAEHDRVHVQTAWINLPEAARRTALASWSPGGDPMVGRGVAIAVRVLDLKTQASMLRHMLTDPSPAVRSAAAEAVGATGTLSAIPQFSPLLSDADADVRLAGVRGLGAMLARLERFAMLRERLGPLANDPDERVQSAVAAALVQAPR
jgi:HEAT repeat protein